MISIQHEFLIYENSFEKTKEELSKFFENSRVKNFISLSKKMVTGGVENLTEQEQTTYRGFFDEPEVINYINAARRAGERDGWLYGGIGGGLVGLVVGGVGGGVAKIVNGWPGIAIAIVSALAGAAISGGITGWTFSKVNSWLRKWRAEDDIVKLGTVGGKLGKTMPILKV